MALPEVVSRDRWIEARRRLLEEEKAHTRARDALSARRRELPMVRIDKPYVFHGPEGELTLRDLFGEHDQLIVSHFMFDPAWEDGCPSCTAGAQEMAPGLIEHLHVRGTELVYVSLAPLEKLERWKARHGWTFRWVSSAGSDFNVDFGVTVDPARGATDYNFRPLPEGVGPGEFPGLSVFLRVGDDVFHTYSSYARGAEWTGGSYAFLDLTALGRQESWERPEGRAGSLRAARPDFAS